MIWSNVPTTCPRCGFDVSFHVKLSNDFSIELIPAGKDPKSGIWLAYRRNLRELVQDVYFWLTKHFPHGGSKHEIVNSICEFFGLIPKHAEMLLEILREEGMLIFPREGEIEMI